MFDDAAKYVMVCYDTRTGKRVDDASISGRVWPESLPYRFQPGENAMLIAHCAAKHPALKPYHQIFLFETPDEPKLKVRFRGGYSKED